MQCKNYLLGIDVPQHIREEIKCFCLQKINFNYLDLFHLNEYHFTIAYLGKLTPEQKNRIVCFMKLSQYKPFKIHIQGMGFLPPGKNPNKIWIGTGKGRNEINEFAKSIRKDIANKCGIIPQDNFFPHITIAKIKSPSNELFSIIKSNWDYPFGAHNVTSFNLYETSKYEIEYKKKLQIYSSLIIEN